MLQTLNPQDWDYLAQGQVHFIVKYVGKDPKYRAKSLRIKKDKQETELERNIDSISSSLFNQYLAKIGLFQGSLLKSTIINLSHQQKVEFFGLMWAKLSPLSKSNKKTTGIDIFSQIELMDNLIDSGSFQNHTCLIEIKPKSPIYDKYEQQTLLQIAQQNNLTKQQLSLLIENLPQKYKIQRIKKGIINDKPHNNQIQSCKFFRGELINYLDQNKSLVEMYFDGSKRVDRGQFVIGEEELNRVVNQILHMEDIFNKLLAVIYLYPKSHSRLSRISKEIVLEVLVNSSYNKSAGELSSPNTNNYNINMPEMISNLATQTLKNFQQKNFEQNPSPIDTIPIQTTVSHQLYELLQFLISSTFRDVSLFLTIQIRAKRKEDPIQVNEKYSGVYKFTILDYEMKSMYRVRDKYLHEDGEYLREFVPIVLKGDVIPGRE